MEIQKLKKGMRVKWNDPGINDYDPEDREWVLNRIFLVEDVEEDDEDPMVWLKEEDGFSTAEAWQHECICIGI